jgi:two-component system, chemotaxis family, chemotaxis protein CheY
MKVLIAEDDPTSRKLLQGILSVYGPCDLAVDGEEAIDAFKAAMREGAPYELVCMDIMMPKLDGHEALAEMRRLERDLGVSPEKETKAIMTTALGDPKNVVKALYREGATAYLVKPIGKRKLLDEIRRMGLIE